MTLIAYDSEKYNLKALSTGKAVQWVKALATQTVGLSSKPRTHM